MSFDLLRLVLERSSFRGKPLHMLALVFIADQQNKDGRRFATRETLVHDTGMSDGSLRTVLRDLVKSGEATGDGGGRGNVAVYGIDAEVLQRQPWGRAYLEKGITSGTAKPASRLAGLNGKHASRLAGISTQTCQPADRNLPSGCAKPASRQTPPNKEPGVDQELPGRESARALSPLRTHAGERNCRTPPSSRDPPHPDAQAACEAIIEAFAFQGVMLRLKPDHLELNRMLLRGCTVGDLAHGAGEAGLRHAKEPMHNPLAYAFTVAKNYREGVERAAMEHKQ